ncbi:MAG: hypothetical protein U0452_15270 [Anaerolineae bacterium]
MALVQQHERAWGNDTYAGRPDLATILDAPVVAFWQVQSSGKQSDRPQITLHKDLREIEDFYVKMIFRSALPMQQRRLYKLFVDGQQMRVASVKFTFAPVKKG